MPVVRYPYLISKWVDPFFGIGIGIFAYYLSERDRQIPPGHSLVELTKKRAIKKYNYYVHGEPSIGPASNKPPGENWGLW